MTFASFIANGQTLTEKSNTSFSMFWLLKDAEIEQPELLESQFNDLKSSGFTSLYVMLRSSRYSVFDTEVMAAAKRASEMCHNNNIVFHFGLDPRFGASNITRKSGHGAQFLLATKDFFNTESLTQDSDKLVNPETYRLNETKVVNDAYNLKYKYPSRRDSHVLTDVGMWFNPKCVEKVYAYQRKNGKVVVSSIRDITTDHHLFINRSFYYLEIFGKIVLPQGDWYVTAFPRFDTNLYAYELKDHQQQFENLIGEYYNKGVELDGFVWDEPGYCLEIGKYVISDQLYKDFQAKYGYDLKSKLYALTLHLDDESQLQVRNDYFNLLTDYVFGAQLKCLNKAKQYNSKIRMGIHATWHDIVSEDMFHGAGNLWKSLDGVDGGYTDRGWFESYCSDSATMRHRLHTVAFMVIAKGLARYTVSQKAHFNQWGVKYDNDIVIYWNDLMAAFSNEWINHSYGYTGVLGADRSFGPGYPNHKSWSILPVMIDKCKKVNEITSYTIPLGEVAIVYPNTTLMSIWPYEGIPMETKILELIGAMPALGIQADVIGSNFLDEATVNNGKLTVRGHTYQAVILPYNKILSEKSLNVLKQLIAQKAKVYFAGDTPCMRLDGTSININIKKTISLSGDINKTIDELKRLNIPSSCSSLNGAYLNLIPSEEKNSYFLTVMPIVPNTTVGGTIVCLGQKVEIKPTKSLSIYKIKKGVVVQKII